MRKTWLQAWHELCEDMNKRFVKEGITDWVVKPDVRVLHLRSMLLSSIEDRKLLFNNWLVLKNRTSHPFHTSDNPVIKKRKNNVDTYYFVLSPKKVIISQEPYDEKMHFRYGFINNKKDVDKINKLIYDNSQRIVISGKKEHLDYCTD